MTDTIRTMTDEMLKLNQQALDWQIKQSERFEKSVVDAFAAQREALKTTVQLQHDTTKAIFDAVSAK